MQTLGKYRWDIYGCGLEKKVVCTDEGGIFLRRIRRDVYIAVVLTGSPTIRVVSHL